MDVEKLKFEVAEIRKKAEAIHCHATRHASEEAAIVMHWVHNDVRKLIQALDRVEDLVRSS